MSEQTANLCTTDAAESLREIVGRQAQELAALKAQPRGVVLDNVDEAASILRNMIDSVGARGNYSQESTLLFLNQALGCLDEVARLNSSTGSAELTECACGDQYPANSFGAGFMAANNGVCENCDAASAGVVDEWAAPVKMEQDLDAVALCGCRIVHSQKNGNILIQCEQHASAALSATAPGRSEQVREVLGWAVDRWHAEVSQRPLHNVHRRSLDDTWRQVIRKLGGDPVDLCGPDHSTLIADAPSPASQKEGGE